METRSENIRPFRPVHPGGILRAELKERGLKQKDFAREIGISPSHLNEILKGKRRISNSIAESLEKSLGIPYSNWVAMQAKYDYDTKCATIDKRELKHKAEKIRTGIRYSTVCNSSPVYL